MKANLLPMVVGRLARERLFWLATVRPDSTPHLAPLWYIWHDECLYVFTGGVKLHNLRTNPAVSVALQDGIRPVILEGEATPVTDKTIFEEVATRYRASFAWNISAETDSMELTEIVPHKVLHWSGEARAGRLPIPPEPQSVPRDASPTLRRAVARLNREHIIWLATVRPNGRPHLVPIWQVYYQDNLYISTSQHSVKMSNIRHQPFVATALPDAMDVVLVEGAARPAPELNDELAPYFVQKFGWDFRRDTEYNRLVQIKPNKILAWHGDYRQEAKQVLLR